MINCVVTGSIKFYSVNLVIRIVFVNTFIPYLDFFVKKFF